MRIQAARRACLLAGGAALALACLPPHEARAQISLGGAGSSAGTGANTGSSDAAGSTNSGDDLSLGGGGPPTPPGLAGAVLPGIGVDPTSPGLRATLLNSFGQNAPPTPSAAAAGPAWQIAPQITLGEEFTNNPGALGGYQLNGLTPSGRTNHLSNDDFVTLITPQVTITDNSERLRVSLFYAPTGQIYAENGYDDQFRQQASGDVLATILPGLLYTDMRGSIYQAPVYGGLGAVNTSALPSTDRETVSTVSFSPYLARSFGTLGSGQAGVAYVYSATDAPAFLNDQQNYAIGIPNTYGSNWLADRRVFANLTTGEEFGRFQDELQAEGNFYDGSGPLRNGQRVIVSNDASYAINRFVAALGEIGYENLHYPNEGFSYVGGIWSAGARFTPNATSSVTAEYRYIDGFYSPYIYGTWQVTPRLHIFGGYSEGITSFDQDQQNALLSGTPNATGAAASTLLAAPLLNNAAYSGANQALNHDRRLTATASYLIARDTVTLNINWDRESSVGNPEALSSSSLAALGLTPEFVNYALKYGILPFIYSGGFTLRQLEALENIITFGRLVTLSSNNLTAGASWHHELQPTLTSDLYLGYVSSRQAATTLDTSDGIQVSAGLNKEFSRRLNGRIAYYGNFFFNNQQGLYQHNDQSVLITLTRTF